MDKILALGMVLYLVQTPFNKIRVSMKFLHFLNDFVALSSKYNNTSSQLIFYEILEA